MALSQSAELRTRRCRPCEGGIPPLSQDEVDQMRSAIPEWKLSADGRSIRREWRIKDFLTAIDFFQRIAQIAEEEDHHPDLHLSGYRNVAVELSTHAVKGLTENDLILAAKIDGLPVELKG